MSAILSRTIPGYRANRPGRLPRVRHYQLVAVDRESGESSVWGRGLGLTEANDCLASFADVLPDGITMIVLPAEFTL
jgi:hypothetical protein